MLRGVPSGNFSPRTPSPPSYFNPQLAGTSLAAVAASACTPQVLATSQRYVSPQGRAIACVADDGRRPLFSSTVGVAAAGSAVAQSAVRARPSQRYASPGRSQVFRQGYSPTVSAASLSPAPCSFCPQPPTVWTTNLSSVAKAVNSTVGFSRQPTSALVRTQPLQMPATTARRHFSPEIVRQRSSFVGCRTSLSQQTKPEVFVRSGAISPPLLELPLRARSVSPPCRIAPPAVDMTHSPPPWPTRLARSPMAGVCCVSPPSGSATTTPPTPSVRPHVAFSSPVEIESAPETSVPQPTIDTSREDLFDIFSAAVAQPRIADASCRLLLGQFLGSDLKVHWRSLEILDPVDALSSAIVDAAVSTGCKMRRPSNATVQKKEVPDDIGRWWHMFLERHGIYGKGDTIGAEEFGELVVSAFRTLRDHYAPEAFIRDLKTVKQTTSRLTDRHLDFEFTFRGALGRTYQCRSRLSREECWCRQVRKDRVSAPFDQVRSEIVILQNIEHMNLPRVVESFEDFNSVYIVSEIVDGMDFVAFLQAQLSAAKTLSESWVASVMRQILDALRYCHEMRPHTIVHGDIRLDSVLLSSVSNIASAPHVIVTDLGLGGLLPHPPPRCQEQQLPLSTTTSSQEKLANGEGQVAAWSPLQGPSPKRDVWSCGCILYIVLTGLHPLGNDDLGCPLLPLARGGAMCLSSVASAASVTSDDSIAMTAGTFFDPAGEALGRLSPGAASLCAQMLSWDVRTRHSASECLRHAWLSPLRGVPPGECLLPSDTLRSVVRMHARSKHRQVVTNLVVSELSDGSAGRIGAALNAFGVPVSECPRKMSRCMVAAELRRQGISPRTVEKVIRAYDPDGTGVVEYGRFAMASADLAEDRLDHSLWRVFTAIGAEHRGILSVAEFKHVLDLGATKGIDWAGGAEHYIRGALDPELTATEIVHQVAKQGEEITFEALKEFVIRRHIAAVPRSLRTRSEMPEFGLEKFQA
eukprot:TRINITY_DN33676_c0_g1_i1.p1 TRINITY_DN33676_c0_g1~~TRINITY_DN33676_c0_g1_i1.p1  ORF type:complete len:978 (+),score=110.97 TRINITY_DN33676_c0_g1_i1:119-3052(+)